MAEFVMLTFDSTYGATDALTAVRALEEMKYAWVDDIATVEKHKHGHVSVHTSHGSTADGAWLGAVAGMLVFWWFPPAWFLAGLVGGAGVGAAIGDTMSRSGLDKELGDRAKAKLTNGTSALLLIGVTGDADQMARAFEKYQPTDVLRETIPDKVVEDLKVELAG